MCALLTPPYHTPPARKEYVTYPHTTQIHTISQLCYAYSSAINSSHSFCGNHHNVSQRSTHPRTAWLPRTWSMVESHPKVGHWITPSARSSTAKSLFFDLTHQNQLAKVIGEQYDQNISELSDNMQLAWGGLLSRCGLRIKT